MSDQMCRCYLPYPEEHPYPLGGGCLCSCHNVEIWAERVRRNITPPPVRDEDPDTTRARAIAVARAARTAAKEKP